MESRTLPTATSSRGFGRRLLHSSLLEALAYPHGVDRYVELVRPLLLKREVRAEVTAVRHQTPRERHAHAAPERELARPARRAVRRA